MPRLDLLAAIAALCSSSLPRRSSLNGGIALPSGARPFGEYRSRTADRPSPSWPPRGPPRRAPPSTPGPSAQQAGSRPFSTGEHKLRKFGLETSPVAEGSNRVVVVLQACFPAIRGPHCVSQRNVSTTLIQPVTIFTLASVPMASPRFDLIANPPVRRARCGPFLVRVALSGVSWEASIAGRRGTRRRRTQRHRAVGGGDRVNLERCDGAACT